jgi:hypothetical protein
MMIDNPFEGLGVDGVGEWIIAVGALGTAAFGLVDASKAVRGGVSNRGFGFIRDALQPFDTALATALGTGCDWRSLMRAHWVNGRPKDEQKALAVGLIQLGLTPDTAEEIAVHGQVDRAALKGVVESLGSGTELTAEQLNVLGRFKATIEARIDAAYERAEQVYRNTARAAAGVVAVLLALAATWVVHDPASGKDPNWAMALLIGLVAVPLAPIARDVASGLATAAKALGRRAAG